MTEALAGMGLLEKKAAKKTASPGDVERAAVCELVKAARARGEDLTGPRRVVEDDHRYRAGVRARVGMPPLAGEEMTEHLPGGDPQASTGTIRRGTAVAGTSATAPAPRRC